MEQTIWQRHGKVRTRTIDPSAVLAVEQAIKEGFIITTCAECFGPVVHSKHKDRGARCLVCKWQPKVSVRMSFKKCKCGAPLRGSGVMRGSCTKCAHNEAKDRRYKRELRKRREQ